MKRQLVCVLHMGLLLCAQGVDGQPLFEWAPILSPSPSGRGTAVSDFTNDGWLDLVLSLRSERPALLESDEGKQFVEVRRVIDDPDHPPLYGHRAGGGSITADFDNDGDLDLYIPVGSFTGPGITNRLLRNDAGTFTDVTFEIGLVDVQSTDNAIWLDFDRDGHLDLYTGNLDCDDVDRGKGNILYRNTGDGHFVDWTEQAGVHFNAETGCGRGTNGGMAAGDFNDDGWPDLYVGAFNSENRLFFGDGGGGFVDATTHAIADPGQAFGLAVGDIDNDGDLDLLQASGGSGHGRQRSFLLLNTGGGSFIDITSSAGLERLTSGDVLTAGFADIDNDADLDLVTISPSGLFLNDGSGIFVDHSEGSGLLGDNVSSFLDYDEDGFQDLVIGFDGSGSLLLHNHGNAHHWLRIELVGTQSNRSAIGARVYATTGSLRQMRELLGGRGFEQDELVVHFGLGTADVIDALEIRWPSGQIDSLFDISADQKIRIIEGQGVAVPATRPEWLLRPLAQPVGEGRFPIEVRPALYEPDARIVAVTANLRDLGGDVIELTDQGDGTFRAEVPYTARERRRYHLQVDIHQTTSIGPIWMGLVDNVDVVPFEALSVYRDGLANGFTAGGNVTLTDVSGTDVHSGTRSATAQVAGRWSLSLESPDFNAFGYKSLQLAIRLANVTGSLPRLSLKLVGGIRSVDLFDYVDVTKSDWQVVDVPMEVFGGFQPGITGISFSGAFAGDVFLDDITFTSPLSHVAPTAVAEVRALGLPQSFALSQNYPNPFNPETTIRFDLPTSGDAELSLFNLSGQRVATLISGLREAGSYTLHWDGRD
ncbi:MAG: hypothetical protein HN796_09005, partial [Gemmatimonadetes bacterium]|nr:hypothetical protein [Gemmatimonadota bacterium]